MGPPFEPCGDCPRCWREAVRPTITRRLESRWSEECRAYIVEFNVWNRETQRRYSGDYMVTEREIEAFPVIERAGFAFHFWQVLRWAARMQADADRMMAADAAELRP